MNAIPLSTRSYPMHDDAVMTSFAARLSATQGASESEPIEDLGAYRVARGAKEWVPMLQIRKKCGNFIAFSYSLLERLDYDRSGTITIKFGAATVTIRGRNLNAQARNHAGLLAALIRQKATYNHEADELTSMSAAEGVTLIDQVEIA